MPIFDQNISGELQVELDEEQIQRIFDQLQNQTLQIIQQDYPVYYNAYPNARSVDASYSPRINNNYNQEFDREELENLLKAVRYSNGMPRDVYDLLVHKLQYRLSEYDRDSYGLSYENANELLEEIVHHCLNNNTRQFNIYLPSYYRSRPDLVRYIEYKCHKYGIDLHIDFQPNFTDMWTELFANTQKPKLKAGWFNEE